MFTVVVAAVVAVVGLWYSNVQTRQANEQAQQANAQARDDRALAKEGQITDRYTAAVGNLGEDKADVRLGGIYALQRIMQDSRRDHPTIANVLAAYIRTHAAKPPAKDQDVAADVHAALTVLATRDTTRDGPFLLDLRAAKLPNITLESTAGSAAVLSYANLRGADLTGAKLHAKLIGADLTGAKLNDADLDDAYLNNANLRGADLNGAGLDDANLDGAYLQHTDLNSADLSGTDLSDAELLGADLRSAKLNDAKLNGAELLGADLRGVDLSGAFDLTREQVEAAVTDGDTRLPAALR
ncbi:pentapeptide repeat-containing protein [Streptomyces sp. NPDC052069]|uniref:pentapeptide repeat-containing protein n=1 Tax=Streptomyces sp. NPDC052069 TaxID=3154650 RepID=UPI0034388B0E